MARRRPRPLTAAIFNTSPDIIDLLRRALEPAGIVTVSVMTHQIREGVVDVEGFLRQHNPQVIVYDIAPPYEANWQLFEHMLQMEVMKDRPIVITSVNGRQVERLAGKRDTIYEVVGKPLDMNRIVRAVKEAARSRPTK